MCIQKIIYGKYLLPISIRHGQTKYYAHIFLTIAKIIYLQQCDWLKYIYKILREF